MTKDKINTEENISPDFKTYELGYLIVSSIPEDAVAEKTAVIKSVLEKVGKVISEDEPKEQELAYKMDKIIGGRKHIFDSAYFGSIIFESVSSDIEKIKKELDANKDMLRYLLIGRTKESLLVPQRRKATKQEEKDTEADKDADSKKPVDEKEIDKEIEDLVV